MTDLQHLCTFRTVDTAVQVFADFATKRFVVRGSKDCYPTHCEDWVSTLFAVLASFGVTTTVDSAQLLRVLRELPKEPT